MSYNVNENKGIKRNDTPTPISLCKFIHSIIKHNNYKKILDPCCGDKRLTADFDCEIINYEIKEDKDFLKETNKIDCELCIMNPPFNLGNGRKLSVEVFMDKVIELCGDIDIVLICPMGFRLNQTKKSKRLIKHKNIYPEITSIIALPVDCFEETLFHAEVILYNVSGVKAHYYPDI